MKNKFIDWMQGTDNDQGAPYSKETYGNYVKALEDYPAKLQGLSNSTGSLFNITSIEEFDKAEARIKAHPDYKQFNESYHRIFSSALKKYRIFLQSLSGKVDNGEKFKVWLQNYKNPPYLDSTIKRYIVALTKADSWLGITLSTHILETNDLQAFKDVYSQITGCSNYEEVNKNHGHGDLSAALRLYELFLKDKNVVSFKKLHTPGKFDSWDIIDETTAIKHCDKSFFDHNGSGVPKEIRWFFDAENLEVGASVSERFLFNGESYEGKVTNDSTDRLRTRIFWNKQLGDLFKKWQAEQSPVAIFRKKQNNTYEIEMKSGEHRMTVKERVESIKSYIASKGFSYDGSLIENFYLSTKTKPFVILAGTSGTGKTKLVRLFAEAIGANYKLVSVRPDWSDSSDLFGHVDLNGKFNEGVILSFVKDAEIHPNTPFFLCLDEMNLARVEYYLSDILSVIETREMTSDGRITTDPLVPAEVFGTDDKAKGKFGVVSLPDNLYIVGTVNMDETTFPFSKKVLDRANTIEFSYVVLVPDFVEIGIEAKPQTLSNDFLKTRYLVLKQDCAREAEYVTGKCEKLQAINEILKEADAHIGYRVRDEIIFYMLNNRKDGLLSEEEALDNEIMQKILPRIQGGSSAVKNMLMKLFIYLAGDYRGYADGKATYEQMRSFLENKGTLYPRSAEKIMYMVRRYEEDGFTSYWL